MTDYSPAEIVSLFEHPRGMQAHEVAAVVYAFYPTIKAALLAWNEATAGAKVMPRPSGD